MVGLDPGAELQEALQRNPANPRGPRPRHERATVISDRRVLAIETSCDETAAAVVATGPRMLSNVIRSQDEVHAPYGGVVPELAARAHLQTIVPVIERALDKAGTRWEQIDGIAVTKGPGLIGCLLVGVNVGQAIAWARRLPVIGVSHLAAHVFAALLEEPDLKPPVLGLVVSGGHSDLIRWQVDGSIEVIGRTRDDAAGEAFDKGARILGLPFPGGPAIDRLAQQGNPRAFRFPRPRAPGLDFSFSGVKTALLYEVRKHAELSEQQRADLAASYQEAIVDALLQRVEAALAGAVSPAPASGGGSGRGPAESPSPAPGGGSGWGPLVSPSPASGGGSGWGPLVSPSPASGGGSGWGPVPTVVLGGGVARNRRLREAAQERLGSRVHLVIPEPELCTDNAAMIGAAGIIEWDRRGPDPAPFDADPSLGFA